MRWISNYTKFHCSFIERKCRKLRQPAPPPPTPSPQPNTDTTAKNHHLKTHLQHSHYHQHYLNCGCGTTLALRTLDSGAAAEDERGALVTWMSKNLAVLLLQAAVYQGRALGPGEGVGAPRHLPALPRHLPALPAHLPAPPLPLPLPDAPRSTPPLGRLALCSHPAARIILAFYLGWSCQDAVVIRQAFVSGCGRRDWDGRETRTLSSTICNCFDISLQPGPTGRHGKLVSETLLYWKKSGERGSIFCLNALSNYFFYIFLKKFIIFMRKGNKKYVN